jgi:hypothetical protein
MRMAAAEAIGRATKRRRSRRPQELRRHPFDDAVASSEWAQQVSALVA